MGLIMELILFLLLNNMVNSLELNKILEISLFNQLKIIVLNNWMFQCNKSIKYLKLEQQINFYHHKQHMVLVNHQLIWSNLLLHLMFKFQPQIEYLQFLILHQIELYLKEYFNHLNNKFRLINQLFNKYNNKHKLVYIILRF